MMRTFLLVTLCLMLCFNVKKTVGKPLDNNIILDEDPDMQRNVSELITSKGYPVEEHTVQTTDGYLLSLIRIPFGRNDNIMKKNRDNVLLIHGILADASTWVLDFPGQSLGFILPDAGYDVWLLNTRGCTYSKRHIKYKANQYKFWNFSLDQVCKYDVPATIDYILNNTGGKNLSIIAHSQGAAGTFGMLSEMPDYNDKLKLIVAIAPATYVGHLSSSVQYLIPIANEIALVFDVFNSGEFLPNNQASKNMKQKMCNKIAAKFCQNFLHAMNGNSEQLNRTRLGVYFSHIPSGTSTKSMIHYVQLINTKKFRKYDYGDQNLKYYHQKEPPDYDLSRITTPVALIWSKNDSLVDHRDIDVLRGKLKSVVLEYCVPYTYNHNDYLLAKNAPKLIYEPILKLLAQY